MTRQLLSIVVAAGRQGLPVDSIADALWAENLPPKWPAAIRMALSRLRKKLPDGALSSGSSWCGLDATVCDIDAWELLELAAKHPWSENDRLRCQALLGGTAFPGIEITPLIRMSISAIDAARTGVTQRLLEGDGPPLTASAMTSLRIRAQEFPEDLQLSRLLKTAEKRFQTSLSAAYETLARAQITPSSLDPMPEQLAEAVRHPNTQLSRYESAAIVGQTESGVSTALLLIAHDRARNGQTVIFFRNDRPEPSAFASIAQRMPFARPNIDDFINSRDGDSDLRLARLHSSVVLMLENALDRPLCLVVDDFDSMDSRSQQLLLHLTNCVMPHPVSLVIGSTNANEDEVLHGLNVLRIPPLDAASISPFVAARFPKATSLQIASLASQLNTLSDKRCGMFFRLLECVDEQTLTLSSSEGPKSCQELDVLAGRLSKRARLLAGAAATLQVNIDRESLERITGIAGSEFDGAMIELLDADVLCESAASQVWDIAPRFDAVHLTALNPPHIRKRHHRSALDLTMNPHRAAQHAIAAESLLTDGTVARILETSAQLHFASMNYREALHAWSEMRTRNGPMPTRTLTDMSICADRTGADGSDLRSEATRQAEAHGDVTAALHVALSGLPATEKADGDRRRLRLLADIDASALNEFDQFSLFMARARQATLLGLVDSAANHLADADTLATDSEQRAKVWLARMHLDNWIPDRTSTLPDLTQIKDMSLRRTVQRTGALGAMAQADFKQAEFLISAIEAETTPGNEPQEDWYLGLVRVALLDNNQMHQDAASLSKSVADRGLAHGISVAAGAYTARRFWAAWITGRSGEFVNVLADAPPDIAGTRLTGAALVAALFSAGNRTDAAKLASQVVAGAVGSRFLPAIAVLVAPAVTDKDMKAICDQSLLSMADRNVVVGGGVVSLGPATLARASLAKDGTDRSSLIDRAALATRGWQSPLWQEITARAVETGDLPWESSGTWPA